jgi:hypothetical protein
VFPGILALAMAIGLAPWVQLKAIVMLFAVGATAFTFLWIRRRGRPLLALGVATLVAMAPGVLTEAHWVLSDVPFWFFTMSALWGFERLPPHLRARFAIAVIATVLAYFTRSAGLPLAVAAFAWLAWRRRWAQLAALALVLGPLAVLWWLRARNLGGVDYVSQFLLIDPYSPALGRVGAGDLITRVSGNAAKYVQIHLPVLLTGRTATWLTLIALLIYALSAVGWARKIRRPGVAEIFLPLYLGLLLVWPAVWSGERFLLPALPLILFYAADALGWIARRIDRRAGFAAAFGALLLLLVAATPILRLEMRYASRCKQLYAQGDRYPCLPNDAWRDFFAVAEATRSSLPDSAVVISRKPRLFFVLGGRPSRIYPFTTSADSLFAAADNARARYLVFDMLDRPTQAYVRPVMLRRPNAFCTLFAVQGGTSLFGILPRADTIADTGSEDTMPSFAPCTVDYWRDAAARDTLVGPPTG